MKFCIVTHVSHTYHNGKYYAYGPYVREMNIWIKLGLKLIIVAPMDNKQMPDTIDIAYNADDVHFIKVPQFNLTSFGEVLKSIFKIPLISFKIVEGMSLANHIHLRCPGNMGLLGAVIQIFFPLKKKTAKYAGNWDPNMKKVWSYSLQRYIISNTFISRNMQVLVYGEWPNQTQNVVPFFTASYTASEIKETPTRSLNQPIKCLYCGYLLRDKRPLQAVKVVEGLKNMGYNIELTLLGDGEEYQTISNYITNNNLASFIYLKGNVSAQQVKEYMQKSHFLTFYGHNSEGWPKVVAESMFWGCVPLVRSVSCTDFMLGYGQRGTIVDDSVESMVNAIVKYIEDPDLYYNTSAQAMEWARTYTLERFENEVKKLI